MAKSTPLSFHLYSQQEWRTAALLFASYLVAYELTVIYVPSEVSLFPAAAIALGGLFFGGLRLWPVVLIAALLGRVRNDVPMPFDLIVPLGITLQAVLGAYLLRHVRIDPLFRRYRDTFYFIEISTIISFIPPTIEWVARVALGTPFSFISWWYECVAMETCLLIIGPFILRWFAKIRFSRTPLELVETLLVFGLLILIDGAAFLFGITNIWGISLTYFLLVPLFWIALRLRPRFVSLALLITALLAIGSVLTHHGMGSLAARLYDTEIFLIALAVSFFTIVSLEEDRRLNTNIMRSQLATLENAVVRVTSESNAKNDFIAILGHELRNPLAPVASGIELLKMKDGREPEEMKTLEIMDDRMDTIRRLLDDLLDISRISEGKIALKREMLDLEQVIRRAVTSTEHHIKERHQALVLKFPKKRKYVMGDPVRLEQVFSNLITNASKYSDSGDTITIKMHAIGERVEVSITDEGVGISPKELESIFTPFHQLDEGGRTKKGLGIGLALVRSFVEMHQGTVAALSNGAGKGSQFIVRLPLLLDSEAHLIEPASRTEAPSPHDAKLSVLVVDDNDAAAAGIGRLLELSGCRVSYAYDGGQALQHMTREVPDVVLLDVGLPDQDGYAVAKKMRADGYAGRLIALTGYSTDDARELGQEAGFDHYLIKPAGLADLKRILPELS